MGADSEGSVSSLAADPRGCGAAGATHGAPTGAPRQSMGWMRRSMGWNSNSMGCFGQSKACIFHPEARFGAKNEPLSAFLRLFLHRREADVRFFFAFPKGKSDGKRATRAQRRTGVARTSGSEAAAWCFFTTNLNAAGRKTGKNVDERFFHTSLSRRGVSQFFGKWAARRRLRAGGKRKGRWRSAADLVTLQHGYNKRKHPASL